MPTANIGVKLCGCGTNLEDARININIIGKYIDERDNKMTVMLILNLIILIILTNYLLS